MSSDSSPAARISAESPRVLWFGSATRGDVHECKLRSILPRSSEVTRGTAQRMALTEFEFGDHPLGPTSLVARTVE
jgi:hypothetical protein